MCVQVHLFVYMCRYIPGFVSQVSHLFIYLSILRHGLSGTEITQCARLLIKQKFFPLGLFSLYIFPSVLEIKFKSSFLSKKHFID